jgi:hypothetical protein
MFYIILPYSNKPTATRKSLSWVLLGCSFIYFSSFFAIPPPRVPTKNISVKNVPHPRATVFQRDRLLILWGIESQYNFPPIPTVPNNKHQRISLSPDVPSIGCSSSRGVGSIWVSTSPTRSAVFVGSVLSLPGLSRSCRVSTVPTRSQSQL